MLRGNRLALGAGTWPLGELNDMHELQEFGSCCVEIVLLQRGMWTLPGAVAAIVKDAAPCVIDESELNATPCSAWGPRLLIMDFDSE